MQYCIVRLDREEIGGKGLAVAITNLKGTKEYLTFEFGEHENARRVQSQCMALEEWT